MIYDIYIINKEWRVRYFVVFNRVKVHIKNLIKNVLKLLFYLPIFRVKNNKVIFDNFSGNGFGDSPKYIALSLIKNNVNCDLVWIVKDINCYMPNKIRKVKYGSIKSYYEYATAKVIIDNVRINKLYKKKPEQFCIQTWHAALGLKMVEQNVEQFLSKNYIKQAQMDGKYTDLMIANNDMYYNLFKDKFWYNGEVKKIGLPRCDLYFGDTKIFSKKIHDYYNISSEKSIILYAPTFRKNNDINSLLLDFNRIVDLFNNKFKKEFVLLIRLHPVLSSLDLGIKYNDVIINATEYPDAQEIIAGADIGLTDYSSIMFEFGMQSKPVFLICKDYEAYCNSDRKLEFEIDELPFLLSKTENQLYECIDSYNDALYKKNVTNFFNMIGLVRCSDSSDIICKIIKNKINEG